MKTYRINEIFYSLQGEGVRSGTANVFIRFSGCNLECRQETEGFDCDTEFVSGRSLTKEEIFEEVRSLAPESNWLILTGGEPSLQVDEEFLKFFKSQDYKIAIETNGTKELSKEIDWICVSPKSAEHSLRQLWAHELKYVRAHGQGIPKPRVEAQHYLISPAFDADLLNPKNLNWCIKLVEENPKWRLSVQQHKLWKIR